ncbi:RCD1 [Acrasis kona]|uniref:RCD1 n=1 Tax=Acrasis kona TaxID=1008807 RepID=A0AAW2YV54_9EUKA
MGDYENYLTLDDILSEEDAKYEFESYLRNNDKDNLLSFVTEYQEFLMLRDDNASSEKMSEHIEMIIQKYIEEDAPYLLTTCPEDYLSRFRHYHVLNNSKACLLSLESIYTEIYRQVKKIHFPEYLRSDEFAAYCHNSDHVTVVEEKTAAEELIRRKSSICVTLLEASSLASAVDLDCRIEQSNRVDEHLLNLKKRMEEKSAFLGM